MVTDPVQELADVLASLDRVTDNKRKPNIWVLGERVRWLHMAISSTRLDVQRQRGEIEVLGKRVDRLTRQLERFGPGPDEPISD